MTDAEWSAIIRTLATSTKTLRQLLDWSQGELGRYAGVSQGGISRVESGVCLELPFHTVVVTWRALARGVLMCAPAVTLPPTTRALLAFATGVVGMAPPVPSTDCMRLLRGYQALRPGQRTAIVAVIEGLVAHPAAADPADPVPVPEPPPDWLPPPPPMPAGVWG